MVDPASPDAAQMELPAAVVVVDPVSTGAVLAFYALRRGYRVVGLYTEGTVDLKNYMPDWVREGGLHFDSVINHAGDVPDTINKIRKLTHLDIKHVLAGSEAGVELTDQVQHALKYPGNVLALSEARRDKWQMGERIRSAGLRAVKQALVTEWEEVPPVLEELRAPDGSLRVILKPTKSCGTDGVAIATSVEEAKRAFDAIMGSTDVFFNKNQSVLVQEFLAGREYVVDCVSHNGNHKVVAFWVYDKRAVDGCDFAYFGLRLFQSDDGKLEERLAKYTFGCLDALGIVNGPSHAEVMWLDSEEQPCLVEVGARPHGSGAFVKVVEEPIGYDQLQLCIDLVDDPSGGKFSSYPDMPPRHKAHAIEVCLLSYQAGRLKGYRSGLDEIKAMPSVRNVDFRVQVGGMIKKTISAFTKPGLVVLCNQDPEALERDYERVHEIEKADLFEVEPLAP